QCGARLLQTAGVSVAYRLRGGVEISKLLNGHTQRKTLGNIGFRRLKSNLLVDLHGLEVTYIGVPDATEARRRDGAGRDLIQRLAKRLRTIREIDSLLARGREQSCAVPRPQPCAHVFQYRGAHLRQVLETHVHVVKDKSDETGRDSRGRARAARGIR